MWIQVSTNVHQKERIPVSHLPGQLALARVPQPEHRRHVEVIEYRDIEPQRVVPEDSELPREFAFGSTKANASRFREFGAEKKHAKGLWALTFAR